MRTPTAGLASTGALAGLLSLGVLGCGDDPLGVGDAFTCDASVQAEAAALGDAAAGLADAAAELRLEVGTACANIASDLGQEGVPTIDADSTDDDLMAACDLATAALNAEITAEVTVEVAIEGGRCEVAADAQFSCEASCDIEGECTPGSVDVRCDPGELSVQCEGMCSANAQCQGSVDVEANCEGSCEATCEGMCDAEIVGTCEGTCTGTCDGTCSAENGDGSCAGECDGTCQGMCDAEVSASCSGSCSGTCTGSCTLDADASVECGADVRCKGGCDGTAMAPSCEGEIMPPDCNLDAECQAGCEGQAKVEASCTPPSVDVIIVGEVNANLESTLEANMPALLNGFKLKGKLALEAAQGVGSAAVSVGDAIAAEAQCLATVGGDVVADLTASAQASASISVSVMASASVSGSAGVN